MRGRAIDADASSETTLQRAVKWVAECNENHAGTKCISEDPMLPLRVLDVQCDSTSTRLSLFETNGAVGKYTTLSHVWGNPNPFTTTRATIDIYKAGIVFDDLPKTFQDAITMTRRLGVRYLWIDALW